MDFIPAHLQYPAIIPFSEAHFLHINGNSKPNFHPLKLSY